MSCNLVFFVLSAAMGRIKTAGGTNISSRELKGAEGNSGRDNSSSFSSNYAANADIKLKEALKELHSLTHQVQVIIVNSSKFLKRYSSTK